MLLNGNDFAIFLCFTESIFGYCPLLQPFITRLPLTAMPKSSIMQFKAVKERSNI